MRALSPCNCNCLPLLELGEALTNVHHHCVLGAPDQCRCVIFFCNNVQCAMCLHCLLAIAIAFLFFCAIALTNVHHCILGAPESCDILLHQCGCAPICMVVHHCVFPSTALSPGLTMGSVRSRVMCKHTIHTLCTLCAHYVHTICTHSAHTMCTHSAHTMCTHHVHTLCAHTICTHSAHKISHCVHTICT